MSRAMYILFGLLASWPAWAAKDPRPSIGKAEVLEHLQDVRRENVKRLRDIEADLRTRSLEKPSAELTAETGRLKAAQQEHNLRQEFLNRLIFQVDIKFFGGDLRGFFVVALKEMLNNTAPESALKPFLKMAAEAVERQPEQRENILGYLEGYMDRSVMDPIAPNLYLTNRNYSNGLVGESGQPMDREDVGDYAEARLKELEEASAPAPLPRAR